MINGLKMIVVVDLVGGFIGRVNSLYTCMMVAERRTSTQYEVEAQRSSLASRTVKRISVLRTSIKCIKSLACSSHVHAQMRLAGAYAYAYSPAKPATVETPCSD